LIEGRDLNIFGSKGGLYSEMTLALEKEKQNYTYIQ
jgi:hypothetical protein